MSEQNLNIPFKPVYGTKEKIDECEHAQGYIYFSTDSGEIFLDTAEERVKVGSSGAGASLFYSSQETDENNPIPVYDEEAGTYLLNADEVDVKDSAIKVDDLIIGTDGAFYRFVELDENEDYICTRMAISGSGGGGGEAQVKRRFKINLEKPNPSTLINGQGALVYFTVESAIDQNDNILDEEFVVYMTLAEKVAGTNSYINYYTDQLDVLNEVRSYFDITEYLRESATTKISLYAVGIENGTSKEYSVEVTTTTLSLNNSASFSNLSLFASNAVNLSCEAIGKMNKILTFYFDGQVVETRNLSATSQETQTYKINQEIATEGSHEVKITLSQARIDPATNRWEAITTLEPLVFEIAVYDATSESQEPIIWLGSYQKEYYNYDNIQIPFMVYNPATPASAVVHLKKDGQDIAGSPRTISTEASGTRTWNIFEIADADVGMVNYYSISCGTTERSISFRVSQDPNRSMELVQQAQLALCFDATGRSNSESESNRILINDYLSKENIPAKFIDFNWYNNGWILDNNRKACLRISNGASLELPIGQMVLNNQNLTNEQSVTFELEFKVRNVQSYDNLVSNTTRYVGDDDYYAAFLAQSRYNNYDSFLHDYLPTVGAEYDDLVFNYVQKDISTDRVIAKYYSGATPSLVGFGIGPQDAFFSNGTDTVNISFIEDKVINLSMVFSYPDQRLYIYNNGVITGVVQNSISNQFAIATDKLIFNSTYCDIDLYKFRIYKTGLNVNEIVQNYAVDKKNISIYDQNGLAKANATLNEYQFDYQSMLDYNEANPNAPLMPYVIYDTSTYSIDKLSYAKKVKIPITFEFVNTQLELAYRNGELLSLAIQDGLCTASSSAEEKEAAVKEYYLHHCPSFIATNAEMAVQGTSSQFYPRRNYKIKTKTAFDTDGEERVHIYLNRGPFLEDYLQDKETTKNFTEFRAEGSDKDYKLKSAQKFFYMDNYTVGTTKFTMKVDYMESSGTYNTGFANLVDNAYSKHPLADYNAAHAFTKAIYTKSDEPFNADETYYTDEKGTKPEEKPTAETYTPGTYYTITGYEDYTFSNLQDYRTSVQGYRVLAFHKKRNPGTSGSQYEFIGFYNMNIDKGSDEMYGFKPDKTVLSKFLKKKAVSKKAECWEFENNSRTFCSFRDPWNRYELSFKGPNANWFDVASHSGPNPLNGDGAPIVVDSFEYRYNTNDDFIDELIATNTAIASPDVCADVLKEFGVDIANNGEAAGNLILDIYKNWEKAVKWVWSTSTKDIASLGTYSEVAVGNEWVSGRYYIYDEENDEYVLDTSGAYQPGVIYRNRVVNDNEEVEYVNAFVSDIPYVKNTYYLRNADGTYVLSADDFDESLTYYQIQEYSDQELATKAARLVEKDVDGVFDANAEYYTYDGSVVLSDLLQGIATPTQKVELTASTYEPDTYYKGITKTYNGKNYKYDTQEYRSAKFFNELADHFDIEYMSTYMIMTEVFQCYDSRGKNLMMATWGPLKDGGEYVWYPIFYDIDTQLGINNTGIPSFAYNVDATVDGNYSTSDSILWNNFYNQFKKSYVLQKYRHLKGITTGVPSSWGRLVNPPLQDIDYIEKWYETDPVTCNSIAMRGARPMIATNLDAWYKYLTITNPKGLSTGETGYMNDNGTYTTTGDTYFYALQGDRSLSRQQFLSNRIEYIDSWLNEGNYQRGGANRIRGRVAANNPSKTSDKWVATVAEPYFTEGTTKRHDFDAEYWINLTPVRSSYVTLSDDNEAYPSQKYDGINPVKFNIDAIEAGVKNSENYPEQLLYIYGMNQMADLGEMHNLYWQEFELSGDARKLTTLNLGYDGESQTDVDENSRPLKWFNKNMNLPTIPGKKPESELEYGLPLLQEVNLSNITINNGSPTLDLTSCEKLKNLRATGSNYQNFSFAEGVALDTLYLPKSITRIQLIEANLLTNLLSTYTTPQRNVSTGKLEAQKGLYVEGLFEDNVTAINTIHLVGGGLGYDSYKLLNKWYSIKDAIDRTGADIGTNYLTLTKVKWSPYTQLMEGDVYNINDSNLYYKDDGHYGLVAYTYDRDTFNADVLSGEIYKLNPDIASATINQISDVEMLEQFITNSKYQSTGGSSVPNISGFIYVNNSVAIDELYIKNTLVKNYPQLTFFFANVDKCYSAKFVLPKEDGSFSYVKFINENITEPSIQKIAADGWFENPYTLYVAEKDNYDFHGWSTTLDDSGLISQADWPNVKNNIFDPAQKDYMFYAIFTIHKYSMMYYDGDGSILETVLVPAGSSIVSNPPKTMAYKAMEDTPENLYKVYKHIGWAFTENARDPVEWTDANIGRSQRDRRFYPVFEIGDVHDNPVEETFFDTEPTLFESGESGVFIKLKEGYNVRGKVTLPKRIGGVKVRGISYALFANDNVTITIPNGFAGNTNITHIFWEDGAIPEVYNNSCLRLCSNLVYVEFPDTLTLIDDRAFMTCRSIKIEEKGLSNCTRLIAINANAFNRAFAASEYTTLLLPASLQQIGNNTFSYNNNVIFTFQFGDEHHASALSALPGSGNPFNLDGSKTYSFIIYTNDVNAEVWSRMRNYAGAGQFEVLPVQ